MKAGLGGSKSRSVSESGRRPHLGGVVASVAAPFLHRSPTAIFILVTLFAYRPERPRTSMNPRAAPIGDDVSSCYLSHKQRGDHSDLSKRAAQEGDPISAFRYFAGPTATWVKREQLRRRGYIPRLRSLFAMAPNAWRPGAELKSKLQATLYWRLHPGACLKR